MEGSERGQDTLHRHHPDPLDDTIRPPGMYERLKPNPLLSGTSHSIYIDASILLRSYGNEVAGSEVAVSRGREEFGRTAIHIFGSIYGEFAVDRSTFW